MRGWGVRPSGRGTAGAGAGSRRPSCDVPRRTGPANPRGTRRASVSSRHSQLLDLLHLLHLPLPAGQRAWATTHRGSGGCPGAAAVAAATCCWGGGGGGGRGGGGRGGGERCRGRR